MKRFMTLLLGMAALMIVPATYAEARDGCGRGWFHNGVTCVEQERGGYGRGSRFYDDGPRTAAPPQYYRQEPRYHGGPPRPIMGRNGTISCGHPGYTWQDGACKPYTGR